MRDQQNKKLRGEILALHNKTPPHFDYRDSLQAQRRDKAIIEDLELYISKLEKEQCDLEDQLHLKVDVVSIIYDVLE